MTFSIEIIKFKNTYSLLYVLMMRTEMSKTVKLMIDIKIDFKRIKIRTRNNENMMRNISISRATLTNDEYN